MGKSDGPNAGNVLERRRKLAKLSPFVHPGHGPRQSQSLADVREEPSILEWRGFLHARPLSSQIPSKYPPQTQGALPSPVEATPWGLGWGGGEPEETDLSQPPSPASSPPGGLDIKLLSLHSLRLLTGFGAPELPSVGFLCKIFLFMLQQCDSAPSARESDPAGRLPCRGADNHGLQQTPGSTSPSSRGAGKATKGVCFVGS